MRSMRARGTMRRTVSSTRCVPSPRQRMSGAAHFGQRAGRVALIAAQVAAQHLVARW